MTGLTCDCGELVATCELSESYSVSTYMMCVTIAVVLWRMFDSDADDEDPPDTMYS